VFLRRSGFFVSLAQIVPHGFEILGGVVLAMSRVEENQEDSIHSAFYIVSAFVIYLFGVLVFLPLGKRVGLEGIKTIVSSLFLLVVALFLVKGYPFLKAVLKIVAVKGGDWWLRRKGLDDSKSLEVLKSGHLWISIVGLFLVYFMLSPLLYSIHPALNGLVLIGIIFTNIYLYMSARAAPQL
jgi:hypothetical protein